ncbi:halocyanin domain-containing protein [Haloparvum sedimenti]|uniref:halocyanin domain-containing protein n=1 Tax=Haloparvum sedimenti TaxID=1678448 RepID=UPI00071E91D0|nr:halocyanin domain-containing protein [Haloparvum sedimenti]
MSRPDTDTRVGRRGFLRAGAAGAAAATGLAAGAGTAAAQYDGWFEDVDNYEGTYDYTGQDEVTVAVGAGGGLQFEPAAILVDPGTTVVWEWTGEGGDHNVVTEGEGFESELTGEAGHTFEHTFDDAESGDTFLYYCDPHRAVGMKGAVAVGETDDELIEPGSGGEGTESGGGEGDESTGTATNESAGGAGGDGGSAAASLTAGDAGVLAVALGFAGLLFAVGLGIVDIEPE